MGLFDALKGLFSGGQAASAPSGDRDGFFVYVRCACGEPIRVRVNRGYDLAQDYSEGAGGVSGYRLTKHIVCPHCYRTSRIDIGFDLGYRERERSAEGAEYLDADQYAAALREREGGAGAQRDD